MSTIIEPKALLFNTSIDIAADIRERVIDLLNSRLADSIDLKMQAKHAHWNVKGKEFFSLHQLFDTIARHCDEQADLIAERVTALGGIAKGTVEFVLRNSGIPDYDSNATLGEQHIRALTKGLAILAADLRADIDRTEAMGDRASADLLTEAVRLVDKDLWFLEAHLQ